MTAPTRIGPALKTVMWVALTILISLMNLVFSRAGEGDPHPYLYLSLLGAVTVPLVLIWRHRSPEVVMVITVVAGTLLTIGASTAWVALGSLFRRRQSPFRSDPWLWASTAAVTGLTYLAVVRDTSAAESSSSIVGILLDEPAGADWREALPWYTEAFITAILMSMVMGVVTLTRATSRLHRVETRAETTHAQNVTLSHELARYEERERIARELHDSLGSKLAAVAMISGALRARSGDPATVRSHAEQVQLAAQEATAEMHEIVRTYRSHAAPEMSLRDVEDLINEKLRRGMVIQSELAIDTTTGAPSAVDRAVYRVIQELTTNAAKHAPGQMLTLRAWGGPEQGGINIFASNPIPPAPAPVDAAQAGGSGIIGAAERVEQLGGWLHTSTENNRFIVQVWVPWRVGPSA